MTQKIICSIISFEAFTHKMCWNHFFFILGLFWFFGGVTLIQQPFVLGNDSDFESPKACKEMKPVQGDMEIYKIKINFCRAYRGRGR